MDLEGVYLDLKGALLHSLPKSGGPMAPLAPGSYVPGKNISRFKDNKLRFILDKIFDRFPT